MRERTTHYYVSELGNEALQGFAIKAITPQQAPPVPPTAEVRDQP